MPLSAKCKRTWNIKTRDKIEDEDVLKDGSCQQRNWKASLYIDVEISVERCNTRLTFMHEPRHASVNSIHPSFFTLVDFPLLHFPSSRKSGHMRFRLMYAQYTSTVVLTSSAW